MHALALVVLSLCLFLEETVCLPWHGCVEPFCLFLEGSCVVLISCVKLLPMSLGIDLWLWCFSSQVAWFGLLFALGHLDEIFSCCPQTFSLCLPYCLITHQGREIVQTKFLGRIYSNLGALVKILCSQVDMCLGLLYDEWLTNAFEMV